MRWTELYELLNLVWCTGYSERRIKYDLNKPLYPTKQAKFFLTFYDLSIIFFSLWLSSPRRFSNGHSSISLQFSLVSQEEERTFENILLFFFALIWNLLVKICFSSDLIFHNNWFFLVTFQVHFTCIQSSFYGKSLGILTRLHKSKRILIF